MPRDFLTSNNYKHLIYNILNNWHKVYMEEVTDNLSTWITMHYYKT